MVTVAAGSPRHCWWSRRAPATAASTTSPSTCASTTSTAPIPELARLLDLSDLYLTASTESEKVPVTAELEAELEAFAEAHGHRDFQAWVGTENYEMRVAPDLAWVDQQVLDIVRATPAAEPRDEGTTE